MKYILLVVGLLLLALALLWPVLDKPPNIIVIYSDDHGWPDIGAAGVYPDLKTPNIDALAASGVRVLSGYSTAPQCVPSRAGLLVGKSQNRFGPGLDWTGSSGTFAGSLFPDCSVQTVAASRGETVTLRVWGDLQSPFGLFLAFGTGPCVPFPGILGGFVLNQPILPVGTGVLTLTSPCLSCPAGHAEILLTIPQSTPIGLSVSLQAAALGFGHIGLTNAITATVY